MLFMKWLFFYDQPIITEDREVKDIWNAVLIPRQESQSPARTSLDPADNYQYPWPLAGNGQVAWGPFHEANPMLFEVPPVGPAHKL